MMTRLGTGGPQYAGTAKCTWTLPSEPDIGQVEAIETTNREQRTTLQSVGQNPFVNSRLGSSNARMIPRRAILFFVCFGVFLAGCGVSERVPTYEVTGEVVFSDGSPLKGGWIICESAKHGLAARGVIGTDGTFRLGTYEQSDGAVAGQQRVAITPAGPAGHDPDEGLVLPAVDQRFTHMDTSGLEFEVAPDGKNHVRLQVNPPGH